MTLLASRDWTPTQSDFDAFAALSGDAAGMQRTVTAADGTALAALTGDAGNGVHVPEPLLAAVIATRPGTRMPGPGTNDRKQDLHVAAPASLGQPITARVTVTRLRPEQRLVDLHARCSDAKGALVCEGRALAPDQT